MSRNRTPFAEYTTGDIAQVLFDLDPCPDGESGRACRWCEAEAVARWIDSRTYETVSDE